MKKDVDAVGLILEAQIAHARAVAAIRADRDVLARLLDALRRADREARLEVVLARAGREDAAVGARLARFLGQARREGLVAEAALRVGVGEAQRLRPEAEARGVREVRDAVDLDVVGRVELLPALLGVDVADRVSGRLEGDRADGVGAGGAREGY